MSTIWVLGSVIALSQVPLDPFPHAGAAMLNVQRKSFTSQEACEIYKNGIIAKARDTNKALPATWRCFEIEVP